MDYKHILSCWHKLEHFSPALLPKDSSVKRLNDLPWIRPLMARDPKKTIQYTIYLGVFSMSSVSDFVKAFFKDESINPNVTDARVCYASVKLDCQGIYIQNSFGLSTMPWALRQLEENKVDTNTWSDDFKELKDNLFERLTENQKELADDNKSYLSDVQTLENLWEIQSLIVQKLKWSTSPQTEIYIRTEEVYKKNNPSDPDESNADILNSFYIEDLERVITSYEKGDYRKTFKDYLSACLNKDFVHSDLSLHPDILRESLIPENYPDGCWPSPYSASLMQQFAVNTVYKELSGEKQEGLFSVNGPPGTGKTTLLRDIIAAILVKRAKNMVRFNDPAKAFRKIGEVQVSEKYTPFIYEPDPSICDGGIVVTSSNNGAVENISKELPLKSEVKGYSDLVGYFRQVSEECLDEKYWGIIAAVLGNKENQRKLIGCIWNGNSEKETYTLKQHLADYKPTEEEWLGVVSSFERKLSEVKAEKSRLTGFMQNAENIEKIRLKLEDIAYRLTVDEKELDTRIEASNLLSAEIDESRRRREEVKTEMQLLQSTRPSFFTYWFSKDVRTQYKKAVASVLSEYNISGERLARQNAELQKLCTEIETLKSKWEKSKREHDEIDEQYKLLLNSVEKAREELKGAYADASFWQRIESKEVQETTPWYSETLKRLQSELFVEAMKVNELFLLRANATSSRIKTTLDGFFNFLKTGGNLTEKEIQAMWNTFWLVVPVVSSTFASIQRMFSSLGTGSIPWLFVDEAGQAVPQAAAGAIWRSKRAVIVGDPFQIEPVVTIPEQIINNFSRYFGLDKTQIHTSLSVQSMADRANPYGWVTNDTWTGSPLRVHRRCIDPMFSIANEIAYNNMMYNSTFGSTSNLIMQNGFVQVEGNVSGRHYVPEQGMAIKLMIMEEIRQLQDLPDLFVISPFSEIPSILKKELRQPIRKALAPFKQIDDDTPKKWLDSHIGTVHTFQGKQAAGVIFCLGLDEKTKGAATWASSKPNLLNVALTRAKFRFVAVGDGKIWLRQPYFCKLKGL
ncbi:ATP-binding protein [Parabacteroides sp. AM58-2XD]|uniref:DEAD/DEAH box helicase n=1 Tax=Parabacteroides TaxID=375288 RepID=UPI000FE1B05C|nr:MULTISPECIES: AAA domain-containing protein [Parabacteroides]MCM0720827.1 AAA domain-containing protein [Parabacteroides sp. W1-Q-101]RGZ02437.1 ATP-binding protein [Parabacteroides sp. AM58-2XD]GKG75721.1 ATP-binding protein [Parabacteroides goldsteinii]GKG80871.1 ATP-binding protein [Parabacteroides goldsteinii]